MPFKLYRCSIINQLKHGLLLTVIIGFSAHSQECPVPESINYSGKTEVVDGVEVYAEKAVISQDTLAEFSGNVEILSNATKLSAQSAIIDKNNQIISAKQGITYTGSTMQVRGNDATLDFATSTISFEDTTFEMSNFNGRGKADTIRFSESDGVLLEGIAFSSCPDNKKDWEIRADSFQIAPGDVMAVTRGTRFYIDDVPLFYLPYFSFPATELRQSGLLFPKISNRDRTGFSYEQPYYFNIAPNIDATLSPRLMALKGLQLKSELRYLTTRHQGQLHVEYLNDNDFESGDNDRYFSRLFHTTQLNKQWRIDLDFNHLSDSNYITDLGSHIYNRTDTQLAQNINVNYIDERLHFNLNATDFLVLGDHTERYRTRPELSLSYDAIKKRHFKLNLHSELAEFTSSNPDLPSATRWHVEPTLTLPYSSSWGEIAAEGKLFHTQYWQKTNSQQTSEQPLKENVTRSIFQGRLFGQLNFERELSLAGGQYLQTLEPKVQYLYTQHQQQNDIGIYDATEMLNDFHGLFRGRQYTGLDRIDHNDQITVGMTSRLFNANDQEVLSLSVGQIFHINQYDIMDQKSADNDIEKSSLAAEVNWNISDQWSVRTQLQLSERNSNLEKANINVDYRAGAGKLIQINHRYAEQISRQEIDQSGITVAWPFSKQWQGVARVYYDGTEERIIENYIGFQYQSCCWAIQVAGGRSLVNRFNQNTINSLGEFDTNFSINFSFTGLGSNNNISDLLRGGLFGYHRPFSIE